MSTPTSRPAQPTPLRVTLYLVAAAVTFLGGLFLSPVLATVVGVVAIGGWVWLFDDDGEGLGPAAKLKRLVRTPTAQKVGLALLLVYLTGFHPTVEAALPSTQCDSGYSYVPNERVCRPGPTNASWHEPRIPGIWKARAALYLETVDIRLFDLDFAAGRFRGFGICREDFRGNYSCG
jgi:hypothetical protein